MAFGGASVIGGLAARFKIETNGGLGSNVGNLRITSRDPRGFSGLLRGELYELPGVKVESFVYVKRAPSELKLLRDEFNKSSRAEFLKGLSNSAEKRAFLGRAGLDEVGIANVQNGRLPSREWQVHHVKPLDDGGTNEFGNLTLIKNEPYHKVLTNLQLKLTKGMVAGDSRVVKWPMIESNVYPSPGGYK